MSMLTVQRIFEVRLNEKSAGINTAFENVAFRPDAASPLWQRTALLTGTAPEQTLPAGAGSRRRVYGIFQVLVNGQKGAGSSKVRTRADELTETVFPRGWSRELAGVEVRLLEAAYHSQPLPDEAWFKLAVSVPFYAEWTAAA